MMSVRTEGKGVTENQEAVRILVQCATKVDAPGYVNAAVKLRPKW